MLSKVSGKAMHQAYRQCSIADGNDTTPMEVDALMKGRGENKGKGKGKEKGKDKGKEKGKGKSKDKAKKHVECEVFLLQGERPRPKGLPQVLGLAR